MAKTIKTNRFDVTRFTDRLEALRCIHPEKTISNLILSCLPEAFYYTSNDRLIEHMDKYIQSFKKSEK